ncbi:hypothetical protein ACHAWF_014601 [Thalassiosira exigua]
MEQRQIIICAFFVVVLTISTSLLGDESGAGIHVTSPLPLSRPSEGHRSLRVVQYSDPKTTRPRTEKTVHVYITKERADLKSEDYFNEAMSVFKTGVLQRYGTGRVRYMLTERAECNYRCDSGNPTPLVHHEPCLAVSRQSKRMLCDFDHLKCSYPGCKTMVTNDEFCTKLDHFDSREYYTSDKPELGYLPIGPRIDSWQSFQTIQEGRGFSLVPASKRNFAFNAIFSRSTNADRKRLAEAIEQQGHTGKLPIFAAMAKEWHGEANNADTKQLSTDEYMKVVLDSVFTLAPAGHNPECFRLFEAVEAGSIPVLSRDDLYGTHHPFSDKRKEFANTAHPCRDSLHHWYHAPILVLDKWDDLYPVVERLLENVVELDEMQHNLRAWYEGYMRKVVAEFEDFMLGPSSLTKVNE